MNVQFLQDKNVHFIICVSGGHTVEIFTNILLSCLEVLSKYGDRIDCAVINDLNSDLINCYKDIPKTISPGPKPIARCCVYKDRAVIEERIALALGGDKENPRRATYLLRLYGN